jgi:citrate lyase subunit beta / citryl-CoA lyase
MILRSLLFVPADSEKKLAKAQSSPADALILDLEDAVAAANRPKARALAIEFLKEKHPQSIWVRVNPAGSQDYRKDLESIAPAAPAGLVIPKPASPATLQIVDRELSRFDSNGNIELLPVATETPSSVFALGDYAKTNLPRLAALTWGAEDLSAALGAAGNRDETGEFHFTYKIVRSLCLIAAKAAGVDALETLHADFRDAAGLERAARLAAREGFSGMLAIHPDQVEIINAAFTPSKADIEHATRVVAAFASGAGVAALDGKMLDQPHLKQAEHVLAVAETIAKRTRG